MFHNKYLYVYFIDEFSVPSICPPEVLMMLVRRDPGQTPTWRFFSRPYDESSYDMIRHHPTGFDLTAKKLLRSQIPKRLKKECGIQLACDPHADFTKPVWDIAYCVRSNEPFLLFCDFFDTNIREFITCAYHKYMAGNGKLPPGAKKQLDLEFNRFPLLCRIQQEFPGFIQLDRKNATTKDIFAAEDKNFDKIASSFMPFLELQEYTHMYMMDPEKYGFPGTYDAFRRYFKLYWSIGKDHAAVERAHQKAFRAVSDYDEYNFIESLPIHEEFEPMWRGHLYTSTTYSGVLAEILALIIQKNYRILQCSVCLRHYVDRFAEEKNLCSRPIILRTDDPQKPTSDCVDVNYHITHDTDDIESRCKYKEAMICTIISTRFGYITDVGDKTPADFALIYNKLCYALPDWKSQFETAEKYEKWLDEAKKILDEGQPSWRERNR